MFLFVIVSSYAALDDSHFEFSGGYFFPESRNGSAPQHNDLMWGFGVDSFIIKSEEQLDVAIQKKKKFILNNRCLLNQEPLSGQITCLPLALEEKFLNESNRPDMILLEQFHEQYDYAEQKQAMDRVIAAYPDISPVISRPHHEASKYREFIADTQTKDLLVCNYPFFGYENNIAEDVLFYIAMAGGGIVLATLVFIIGSDNHKGKVRSAVGLIAILSATALITIGMILFSSLDFGKSLEGDTTLGYTIAALVISLVIGATATYKSSGQIARVLLWIGLAIAFSSSLALFFIHDNAHEYAVPSDWIYDMNELRQIREDTGVRFYVWIKTAAVYSNIHKVEWNSNSVAFTKWSMNVAIAFGTNGIFFFLMNGPAPPGYWQGPVIYDYETEEAYKSQTYDELSSALQHVRYNGKKIKEKGGILKNILHVKYDQGEGCVLKSVSISEKNEGVKREDLDILISEYSTGQRTLVFIVNNHLARCVVLKLDFGSAPVRELSNEFNSSQSIRGYRSMGGNVVLCSGDSKLFEVEAQYPEGCRGELNLDEDTTSYRLAVLIISPILGTLGIILFLPDYFFTKRDFATFIETNLNRFTPTQNKLIF